MSMDKLIQKIVAMNNPTVAGLDPKLDFIPGYIKEKAVAGYGNTLKAAAEALYEFNVGLIDALCDIVPAVKPQCAYYEMYGAEGVDCLARTIRYAKAKGMYVITDGKRNDIGTTMEAYAKGHLGQTQLIDGSFVEPFGGDALTVNGYLGSDGIKPLLETCKQQDKGIFVLVKTSNPSSGELQDRLIDGRPVYEIMGEMCESWGEDQRGEYGYSAVGAVVGATYPEQLTELREKLPHTFFLVPGYGAQGGG
ncbi:MAG: orotidine-5'-phosphate decarboxylase, partial [Massilioclostridium sp.]|nr:orotidine-5'-phosphate decarboxylase [Massilioclostridium sp.]